MSRVSQSVYTGALAKALGAGSHSCKGRACTGRPTCRFLMPLSFCRPDLPPHEFTASFHAAARVTVNTRKGRRCEGRGVPVPQKARGGTQLASSWSSAPSSPPAVLQTGKPKPREAAVPSKLQGSKKQQNGGVGFCALFTQKPCWGKSAYGGTMNREKTELLRSRRWKAEGSTCDGEVSGMEGATVTITAATRQHLCAVYRLPVIRVAL